METPQQTHRCRHRANVLGGTALLPNLSEFMERELGVPGEVGDPLVVVAVDHSAYPPINQGGGAEMSRLQLGWQLGRFF